MEGVLIIKYMDYLCRYFFLYIHLEIMMSTFFKVFMTSLPTTIVFYMFFFVKRCFTCNLYLGIFLSNSYGNIRILFHNLFIIDFSFYYMY